MLQRKGHIPYSIYRAQPPIYIGSGILTLVCLPNIYGVLSGLLLICAGVLVVVWRNQKAAKRREQQPSPQGGRQAKRTADMRYAPDPGGADKARASMLTSEQNDFRAAENIWRRREPGNWMQDRIYHIDDGSPVTASLLSRFSPFNELSEPLIESFARRFVVSRKPAGSVLINRGSRDDMSIYLIEGALVLEPADGRKTRVVGGTPAAFRPLCQLSPHIYSAIPETEVAVIILSQTLLRDVTAIVAKYKNMPGIRVAHLVKT